MACEVVAEAEAIDRLAGLGLSVGMIERVVRRADADASMCTAFDPPIMEGLTRWGRTNRYLREELAEAGWRFDNPRNLPRTIHPGGEFAIVATTGDGLTGLTGLDGLLPATKHAKGFATAEAVARNGQLTLDFGDFDFGAGRMSMGAGRAGDSAVLQTWFMLFHVDEDAFRVEVSLPDRIIDGRITSWAERIILPPFPREDDSLGKVGPTVPDDEVVVAVTRR